MIKESAAFDEAGLVDADPPRLLGWWLKLPLCHKAWLSSQTRMDAEFCAFLRED
jgi:hypothetical protein